MEKLLTMVKENKKTVLAFVGVALGLVAGALLLNKPEEKDVIEVQFEDLGPVETEQV